jgi:tetratricopeptide (TPR) repeat protein
MPEFMKPEEEIDREEPLDTGAAAVALALDEARAKNPPSPAAVERFLARQEELIADQRHHLAAQYRTLTLDRWSKRFKLATQALTILVGVLAFGFVGRLVWQAESSDSVVIEPFGVPPDLAAKGYTGQALAARIQDELNTLQAETRNARVATTYATDWGHEIKVEIPETGVSLGELSKLLRQSFGHERHVGGDLVHTPTGLALTVRSEEGGESVTGAEADLTGIVTRAAEALYRRTQPYRYGSYLAEHKRFEEARAVFTDITENGPPDERPWGLSGLASLEPDPLKRRAYARQALAINPNLAIAWHTEEGTSAGIGDYEAVIRAGGKYRELLSRPDHGGWRADAQVGKLSNAVLLQYSGDFSGCLTEAQEVEKSATKPAARAEAGRLVNFCMGLVHDVTGLHQRNHGVSDGETMQRFGIGQNEWNTIWTTHDWAYGLQQLREETQAALANPNPTFRSYARERLLPQQAMMLARLGRVNEARSAMGGINPDGYWAMCARAYIAGAAGDPGAETAIYQEIFRRAPHVAWTYTYASDALFRRGAFSRAVEIADRGLMVAPRYDALHETKAEALVSLGKTEQALRSFKQANSFAPKWGRMHLKWGEALARLGRRNDAKVQFQTAAGLDLAPEERAELNAQRL